jgi:hypothetical protein
MDTSLEITFPGQQLYHKQTLQQNHEEILKNGLCHFIEKPKHKFEVSTSLQIVQL